MEITVKEGRGYKMSDGVKKENREIGYMEIDSIFSPVILVSISVDSTRVGKMTNWDKLILDIKTDGTITPLEAFDEAVKVLVGQYNALLTLAEPAEETGLEMAAEEEIQTPGAAEEEPETKIKADKKEKKEKKEPKEPKKKAKK